MIANKNNESVRTWIEVDRAALKKNYQTFRDLIGDKCQLMAVAKSNAYGHSLADYAREMEGLGADWIGVDSIVEGLTLRREGVKTPILVLGYTLPQNYATAVENKISLSVSSHDGLELIAKNRARFHLKVDTGMHRQGFLPEQIPDTISFLQKNKTAPEQFEGIYTHFAAAKNPAFPRDTLAQMEQFESAVRLAQQAGYSPIRHAAASSGTLLFPQTHYDLVRVGISLYGLWPSAETAAARGDKIQLAPALTWKTIIGEVKKLPAGERIGYDFTETLTQESLVAVCPVGYWHGYPRALSSIGRVAVNGKPARVLGRVSMDMITIDVTDIPNLKVGDEVTLLGGDATNADMFATLAGTSSYEIVTRLNPLIKRVYI